MRYVSGHVTMSSQMLNDVVEVGRAWKELEWIATHWDEATDEQRAQFERFEEAQLHEEAQLRLEDY